MTTTVTVQAPFQVVHEGVVYYPGQSADVDDDSAAHWEAHGWAAITGACAPSTSGGRTRGTSGARTAHRPT